MSPPRLHPESKWLITLKDGAIGVWDDRGRDRSVLLSELSRVDIETNDTGPVGADVWWLLFGPDDRLACAFPQGATGEESAVDLLMTLPSFDHLEMTNAMRSTNNATFSVRRRR